MSDCPNAEIRDQLPDFLHERLDEHSRAAVMAHVADCVDCHVELALLREARVALSPLGVVSIDVASITRVVVERTRMPVSELPQRGVRWTDWRIAASIVALALGAGAVAIARGAHQQSAAAPVASVGAPIARVPNVGGSSSVAEAVDRGHLRPNTAIRETTAELSAASGVSELSESDLQSLVESLNDFDAVPATEPEPVTVRVSLPGRDSSQ